MSTKHAITGGNTGASEDGRHGRAMRVALKSAYVIGALLTVALLVAAVVGIAAAKGPKPHKNAPVANSQTVTTNEDSPKTITLRATDPNGDALSFAITDQPEDGTLGPIGAVSCDSATKSCQADITYTPDADFDRSDSFQFSAKDRKRSSTATVSITLSPVNDAPENTVPGAQSTDEDAALVFPSGNSNQISTSDVDAGSNEVKVTLGVSNGKLTLSQTTGLSFTSGANGDATMSFTGTLSDVNAALAGLRYQPDSDYNGSDTLSLTTDDQGNSGSGGAKSDTDNVAITVNVVDDPPVANDDSETVVDEDSGATNIDVLANDTDGGDGGTKQISSTSDPTHGKVVVAADNRSLSYEPNADYCGPDSFTYTLNGGSTAKVTVTVTCLNDPPVAEDDSASVGEGGTVTGKVLDNDKDVDGDTLNAVLVDGPSHASSFSLNGDGSFSYVHNGGETTSDSFTYRANDGTADSNVATVNITVNPTNDAPVAKDDPTIAGDPNYTTNEDTALSVSAANGALANDTDAEGDSLKATLVSGPDHAAGFTLNPDGSFDYTPEADFNGDDSFTYKASDGTADSNTATVMITVSPVNDAPSFDLGDDQTVVNTAGAQTASGFAKSISAGPSDESGQKLTFTVTNDDNSLFTSDGQPDIDEATGDLTYTPDSNASGTATVTVELKDDGGTDKGGQDTTTKTFKITVRPPNATPVADSQTGDNAVSATEDLKKQITLSASDDDDEDLTFGIVSGKGPSNGTLGSIGSPDCSAANTCTATVDYTPAADFNGADSFKFKVNDGKIDSNEATVDINVAAVNDVPTNISLDTTSVEENKPSGTAVGSFSTTDADTGDTHTYSLVPGTGGEDNGSFTIEGNTLKTSAQFNFETKSSYSILVEANDDHGGTFNKQFTITITNVNDAPTDISLTKSDVDENKPSGTTVGALSATDPDTGQTHSFALVSGCGGGTFDNGSFSISGGDLKSAASFDYETKSSYTICVRATDNGTPTNLSVDKPFTISINDVNDAPVLTTSGGATTFTEDGPAVAVDDSLTVADADSADLTGATVKITSNFASGQDELLFENQSGISGSLSGDTLTLSGTSSVANYQAALRSVTFRNTSQNPSNATRTVSFTVNDGSASSNTATKSVNVTPVNDAPVLAGVEGSTSAATEQVAAAITSTLTVADVDSANLTGATVRFTSGYVSGQDVLAFADTANIKGNYNSTTGVLTLTGSDTIANYQTALRSITYTNSSNAPDTATTRTIGFKVDDGGAANNLSNEATRNLTVTAVNDTPTAATRDLGAGSIQTNMKRSFAASDGLLKDASDPDAGGGFTPTFSVGTVNGVAPTGGTITTTIPNVGTVTANQATGAFDFDPAPGVTGNVSFNYTICDNGNPAPSQCSAPATITLNIAGPVIWFVDPAAATNGNGTLASPFNTLAAANAVDAANHRIFVYSGTTPGGIALNNGEWLIGQGVTGASFDAVMGITPPTGTISRPNIGGTKPVVGNTAAGGNAVSVTGGTGIQIKGLSLSGNANAIDVTTTTGAGVTIADNAITSAGQEGIDVNAGGGAVSVDVQNNAITSTGNGFDARTTAGTLGIVFSTNTNITSGASGVLIDGSAGGTTTVTGFANNTVSGATTGTGISVTNANFGGGVNAGTTAVGVSGNGVGGSGVVLTNVQGSLSFADLDVFADGGAGVRASGAGTGLTLAVGNGLATVEATGGPALDLTSVAATLQLASLKSTNSATTGVSLASVTGTVSAPASSSISNATGTDFSISGGSAAATYNGTITDDVGQLVSVSGANGGTKTFGGAITDGNDGDGNGISLTNNTGATIAFSGGLTLSTGANPAFAATGGGTVTVTGSANTIATTTGTALNVSNTTIGDSDLTFRSIASNGAARGIALSNTSNANGRLFVTSTGSGTCQNGSTGGCTGGLIQNSAQDGVLMNAVPGGADFVRLGVIDAADHGIHATNVASGIKLSNSALLSNGNATADNGIEYSDVRGVTSIQSSDIIGSGVNNDGGFDARIANSTGTLHLTVNDNDINLASTEDGLQVKAAGSGEIRSNITGNRFDDNKGDAFQTATDGAQPSSSSHHTFTGNTIDGKAGTSTDGGVVIGGAGDMRANISNNTIKNVSVTALVLNPDPASTSAVDYDLIADGNTIGDATNIGSDDGDGIQLHSTSDGPSRISITNNTIRQYGQTGITVRAAESTNGANTQATVTGNNIGLPDPANWWSGIWLQAGSSSSDVITFCADVGSNTFTPIANSPATIAHFVLDLRFANSQLRVPNFTGNSQAYFLGRNTGLSTFAQDGVQNPVSNPGTCTAPSSPLLPTAP